MSVHHKHQRLQFAKRHYSLGLSFDSQIRDGILSKRTSEYIHRKRLDKGRGLTLACALVLAARCESIEEPVLTMLCTVKAKRISQSNFLKKEKGMHRNENAKRKQNRDNENNGKCYRCYTQSKIQNALNMDRYVTSAKEKTIMQKMCRTKGLKTVLMHVMTSYLPLMMVTCQRGSPFVLGE